MSYMDCSGHSFYEISEREKKMLDDPFCRRCGQNFEDFVYGCRNCSGIFHKMCTELPNEIQAHPCHPQHVLTLLSRATYYDYGTFICNACRRDSSFSTFNCEQCRFDLDIECAMQNPTIHYDDGDHLLFLFNKTASDRQCAACDTESDTPLFSCVHTGCRYNLHLHCAPLSFPETIKHERHWHPLTLITSLPQDKEEGVDEFYCDVCEKERNPKHPLYYCKECGNKGDYIAHMACALSEVLPSLVAKYEMDAKARSLAEDQVAANLYREIEKLRDAELSLNVNLKRITERLEERKAALEGVKTKIKALKGKRAERISSTMTSTQNEHSAEGSTLEGSSVSINVSKIFRMNNLIEQVDRIKKDYPVGFLRPPDEQHN